MAHLTIAAVSESTYGGKGLGAMGALMKSTVVKRSIVIGGHKTSVSLEDAFWSDLKEIAHTKQATLGELVERIDRTRDRGNLSSAIRLFVLEHVLSERSSQSAHAAVSAEGTQVTEP
jgi:predicted DNA-binding ribbon-helix-helix protein